MFFCNSGTESVEAAIKFARCFTRKQRILFCDHAFHGLTVGALSLNGSDFFRERFGNLMPDTSKVPFNDLEALEKALWQKDTAAFVVEPVQGKTCEVAADGYLAEAGRLCRKAGAPLVADEVQCGLGRTGEWFAYQHWPGVEPDIVCVAKALSGGYVPVGAVIAAPDGCRLRQHGTREDLPVRLRSKRQGADVRNGLPPARPRIKAPSGVGRSASC